MKRQREKESCKNSECSGAQMKRYCRQPAHKSLMKFRAFFKWKDSHKKNHGVCFVCVHVCERFVRGKPPHVQDHIYKCAYRIKTIDTIVHIKVYRVLLLWTWKSKSLSSCVTDCYSFILRSWHMVYIISRCVYVHVFFSAFMTFLLQTHATFRIRLI